MLKNIDIEKYKCFENFELNGLSRINIISGKNNVGKTALLECLYIQNTVPYEALGLIAKNRDIKEEYFQKHIKDTKFSFMSNNYKLNHEVKNKDSLTDKEQEEKNKLNADYEEFICTYFDDDLHFLPLEKISMVDDTEYKYINSSKPSNSKLTKLYSKIQTLNLQYKFLEYLQLLDDNIKSLEPYFFNDELVLRATLIKPEISLITSELGEGLNRYIEILASMLSVSTNKDVLMKAIFIDEIENGLHYSKLVDIAKAIIEISQKEDIQVFITTHDKDIIEAFSKASEEMEFKDICSIELYKDDENNITSIVRNHEQFIATVDVGMEVR